jgi:hypothetical protein
MTDEVWARAHATVVAAKGPIGDLGGTWMTVPEEEAATAAAGLAGWQLYFLGRHGVLGDVDADVVTASAVVFPADHVRTEWEAARRVLTPEEAVQRYLDLLHAWGRQVLTGCPGLAELIALSTVLVDSVDVVGLPLFAGWRALPRPSDDPAHAAHLMQLLREHRGSCHGVALVAAGVPPLVAILANQGGAANALDYGWTEPFPTVTDDDRARRAHAEELTDDIVTPGYLALGDESEQFVDALRQTHSYAFGA